MPLPNAAGELFFVDESALGLGKGMSALRRDTLHAGHAAIPQVPLGSDDVTWMPIVARRGLIALGRDKKVRSRPAERQRILDSGLRYIWIGGKRDESSWEWMRRLMRHWDALMAMADHLGPGPWIITLNQNGIAVNHPAPAERPRGAGRPG